jgi:uncharacterized OB-fold protein
MDRLSGAESSMVVPGEWNLRYEYFAGAAAEYFYRNVKDNAELYGARCDQCSRVLIPPRGYCEVCYRPITDWVKVSNEGIVRTFTILTLDLEGLPPPPILIAYVQLDGATTSIANYLQGVDLSDVETVGRQLAESPPRVRAVFREKRTGSISDFHFELIPT